MITVIDHARPWLIAEQRVGGDDPPPALRPENEQRHGQREEPSDQSVGRRACRSASQPETRFVNAFARPNVAMNERTAVVDAM